MNISLILTNKCFTKRAYYPEGLLSREGLLFRIYGIQQKNEWDDKIKSCVFYGNISGIMKEVYEEFYGKERETNSDLCRIIDDRHYQRLTNLIQTTQGNMAINGKCLAEERFIDLHVSI